MWKRTTPPILKRCLKHDHPRFDTHKLVRRLIESGFSEEQVEVVTDAIKEAQDSHDIATRHDLRELELRIDTKFEKELAPIRVDLLLVKWMLGSLLGGVMTLLLKTFFPS